jgi:hypothetical protein
MYESFFSNLIGGKHYDGYTDEGTRTIFAIILKYHTKNKESLDIASMGATSSKSVPVETPKVPSSVSVEMPCPCFVHKFRLLHASFVTYKC